MRSIAWLSALLPFAIAAPPSLWSIDRDLHSRATKKTCYVKSLGSGQNDAGNILNAFSQCKSNAIIVLNETYTVGTLLTANLTNVEIQLTGTIQYTNNISYWSPNSLYLTYQNATTFFFLSGSNIKLQGPGTIDGNGQLWWDTYATNQNAGVAGGSSTTFARPIPLTIGNATNVLVDSIRIIQSPFWHQFCYQSTDVTYSNMHLSSLTNSTHPTANTDGIDIYRSKNVHIKNWIVNNSDDCVSFKPNATDVMVENLNCNGSHGISVGSLGQYKGETDIVENIYVKDIVMSNAQNGARIKVFPGNPNPNSIKGGGTGHVKNITFENFQVVNTDYPILIDQCYNVENATFCAQYPSQVSISDVHYIGVTGTSSGKNTNVVAQLECSAKCADITSKHTRLLPPAFYTVAKYLCLNIETTNKLDFPCTAP